MPSNIALVALDIDGTLLPEYYSRLTPRLRDGLIKASKTLHLTFITGRSFEEVKLLLEDIGNPKAWLGLGGGGEVRNPDRQLVYKTHIDSQLFERVISFSKRASSPDHTLYALQSGKWGALKDANNSKDVLSMFIEGFSPKEGHEIYTQAVSLFPELYLSKVPDPHDESRLNVFFQPKEATKAAALKFIQSQLGIGAEQTAAVGDTLLDSPMFPLARMSAAMGNATDDVKAQAKLVLKPATEDGVADIIERILEAQRLAT